MSYTCFSSAAELASGIRNRDISSMEVLQLFLAQYQRHHAAVNAICTLDAEGAERAAKAADLALARGERTGVLHGLPVSFKDSYATAGLRTVCGYPPCLDHVPAADSTVVARVREAGGIVFAKTNVPPLLGGFHTDNPVFGRTNNPWDLSCSPGGSSGGSAAALAAGMSALDMGSDMMGSIRLPAHYCGVCGLKPTQYSVPSTGHYPPLPGAYFAGNVLATRGPMARRIADLLLVFPVIAGYDPDDPESMDMLPGPAQDIPLERCRVAWTDDFGGVPVSAETRAALERTALALAAAGCRVEKTSPAGLNFEQVIFAAAEIFNGTISQGMSPDAVREWSEVLQGEANIGTFEAGLYRGVQQDYRSWFDAMTVRLTLIRQLRTFFDTWDVWMVPTSSAPAFRHGDVGRARMVDGHMVPYLTSVASHVAPFNLSGSPAVTMPVALSSEGLPIGVQLVGRHGQDISLLKLAERVEGLVGIFPAAPGF